MEIDRILEALEVVFSYRFIQVIATLLVALVLQMVVHAVIPVFVRRLTPHKKFATDLDEEKRENTLINIFSATATVVIWLAVIMTILVQLNVNIAALATGAGLVGIVVGFGAQNTIKDMLAGFFIILENQYRVGDIVMLNVAGTEVSGVVETITVRITRLRDLDGNLHIVPNGSAVIITNLSLGFANVNVDVGVSYAVDVDKVEKVINTVGEEMAQDETLKNDILEPIQYLRVDSFGESAVNIKALGKVRPGMQWDIAGEYRRRLKKAFEKNNIEMPLPQVVVHQAEKKLQRAEKHK